LARATGQPTPPCTTIQGTVALLSLELPFLTMIYLDYHATTPVDPRVAEKVLQAMTTDFGNASSLDHGVGNRAKAAVKQATRHIAELVGATPRDILFTSGATESLNLVIQGTINALTPSPVLGEGLGVRANPA